MFNIFKNNNNNIASLFPNVYILKFRNSVFYNLRAFGHSLPVKYKMASTPKTATLDNPVYPQRLSDIPDKVGELYLHIWGWEVEVQVNKFYPKSD